MTMNLWKKIGHTIRHRLVLQKLTQRVLVKLGIRIEAHYWTQEGLAKAAPSGWERDLEDYRFSTFGPEEMQTIASLVPWRPAAMTQAWLDEGRRCFGIKHRGQIAAYVWCNLTECMYPWHKVPLADNEVYLFDQFTLDAFRGRNIAPYLRHRTYGALRDGTRYVLQRHAPLQSVRRSLQTEARRPVPPPGARRQTVRQGAASLYPPKIPHLTWPLPVDPPALQLP